MEKFVLISNDFHRDFIPEESALKNNFLETYLEIIIKGIIAGLFGLFILYIKRSRLNSEKNLHLNRHPEK